MTDLFLGVIAAGVVTMAIIQVAAIVFALRAARRVGDAVSRFEQSVQPLVANLQSLTSEAARATSVAAAQVERASQMMGDLARRVDETAAAIQSSIVRPAREGYAVFQGIIAALAALRTTPPPRSKRPAATDEEDALFIG